MNTCTSGVARAGGTVTELGAAVPFDVMDTPGAYVCNWSGHLLRVSQAAITAQRSLAMNIVGNQPLTVTKISDDPTVPLAEAKRLAAAFKLDVRF